MDFFSDYLLFAAKLATALAMLGVPVIVLLAARAARRGSRGETEVDLEVRQLNDHLLDNQLTLEAALLPARAFKKRRKELAQARKARARSVVEDAGKRAFVIHFSGDLRATAVLGLREEVTTILAVARSGDEVIVVLESGGGTIHGYGLAASQLRRIRDRGIRLRVVVDRIAASGGYMMACVADEVIAAPFAIIGSIGVIAQLPNFHRMLQKHDIDYEQITAGEYKRTLTVFGENTAEGRDKFQAEIDDAHALFKSFVATHRPGLDLDRVGTGEWWFATRAIELGLVDRLATSDDVIGAIAAEREVFMVKARRRRGLLARLSGDGLAGLWRGRGEITS